MSKIVSKVPTLPVRASDLHKGTFGTVRVVFRSAFMLGAAILCARGAAGISKRSDCQCKVYAPRTCR